MKIYKIAIILILALLFIFFPLVEQLMTGMIPGSSCCLYSFILDIDIDSFNKQYDKFIVGEVNARDGKVYDIGGSYFLVVADKLPRDTTKTYFGVVVLALLLTSPYTQSLYTFLFFGFDRLLRIFSICFSNKLSFFQKYKYFWKFYKAIHLILFI